MVRGDRPEPACDYGSWVEDLIKQFCLTSAYGKISPISLSRTFALKSREMLPIYSL
jgi:hypothetical protein